MLQRSSAAVLFLVHARVFSAYSLELEAVPTPILTADINGPDQWEQPSVRQLQTGTACGGGVTVDAPTTVEHPATSGSYGNNERCFWRVQCTTGRPRLSFSSFSTERNFDFVYLYEYAAENALSNHSF